MTVTDNTTIENKHRKVLKGQDLLYCLHSASQAREVVSTATEVLSWLGVRGEPSTECARKLLYDALKSLDQVIEDLSEGEEKIEPDSPVRTR